MFHFDIVTTLDCNLKCKYCYMKHLPNTNMSKDTFLKHYNENLPRLMDYYNSYNRDYSVTFFGGEPLMNLELMTFVSVFLKNDNHAKEKVIITNGLILTSDMIDIIRDELGVGISLSFDGMWNYNNRIDTKDKSTFDHYISNKHIIKKINYCKAMISPESLKYCSLKNNYEFFRNNFGNDFYEDFTIVRDDIWSKKDIKLFDDQLKELLDYLLIEINEHKKFLPIPSLLLLRMADFIVAEKTEKRSFSCFAGCNGAGFMPDGTVYPCSRFGSADQYQLIDSEGNMNQKNLDIMLKNSDITKFTKCQSCQYYKYCTTGCTFQQVNNKSKPINSVCQLIDITFKACEYFLINVNEEYKFYMRKLLNNMLGGWNG